VIILSNLSLIKSEHFGEVQADIYSNGKEVFMTAEQLGECLGYSHPRESINKLVSRNEYLRNNEFSAEVKLTSPSGTQSTRVFTEDGIYEVTMLSKTENAKKFRAWVRKVLKALRKGEAKIVGMTEYQQMMAETRERNARIRSAQILTSLANQYDGTYKQVLHAHATKELTGEYLLPLPKIQAKTYSATEIGDMLGISANKVGILANRHGLKTDEYGAWYNDKAKHSTKEVSTFRYYEGVLEVLRVILSTGAAS